MDWSTANGHSGAGDVTPSINVNGINGHREAGYLSYTRKKKQGPPPLLPSMRMPSANDPPASAYIECLADLRVLAQTVVITEVSFLEESFRVFTELTVIPLVADLASINLHLGKYALLPNETNGSTGRVTINDVDANYRRTNIAKRVLQDAATASLGEVQQRLYVTHYNDDTQLQITIPHELQGQARAMGCLKVGIDVLVKKPKSGVQFVTSFGRDGSLEKGAHVFTYKSSLMTSTREWLPCLDAPDQLALWRLNVTCDAGHTAVASGELMDVELSRDMRRKTFFYQQSVPTAATNMGWAIGHFSTYGHPEMAEVTSFAPPGLMSLLKHTVVSLDKILEYFEELLSCRYPFPSYKQVFVDQLPDDITSYSSLSLFSVNMLYHKKIIDVAQESRQLLAFGIAQQFFGCFLSANHWLDWGLVKALARMITSLYIEKVFGHSEFVYQIKQTMEKVIEYEAQWGKIQLRATLDSASRTNLHCDPRHELTCSPLYADAEAKKAHLTMRMLRKRLGNEQFQQVLHKLLSVGQQMSEKRDRPAAWTHMILSMESFFRTVTTVTGHEISTFLEQWVYEGGHAAFEVQYTFNRRRNVIELEVRQDLAQSNGRQRYLGPLTVVVQELDGAFSHTIQIDGDVSRSDLQCHSKGRRQKKKRVPLYSGEEVEVDLAMMDPDSPVLWIRVDPELNLLRQLVIRQPNYQWEYMLTYERDVLAQLQSLEQLQQFPSAQSRMVLNDTLSNDYIFYRVRCRAAHALTAVLNRMSETWSGVPQLITLYRDKFGAKSCPLIPRSNNFVVTSEKLQQYFLMQALPQAVSKMRTQSGAALQEVQQFVLDLIRFNDNSTNRYADDHYRAALLTALWQTVVPVNTLGGISTPDTLGPEMKRILQELTLALNMDTMKPSFGRVVGLSALQGIYQMQRNGHLPHDSAVFWSFAQPKLCLQMRKGALCLLISRLSEVRDATSSAADAMRLLAMAHADPDPAVRLHIATHLALTPPFSTINNTDFSSNNPCNTAPFADEMWRLIGEAPDTRVRLLLADAYFSMFGLGLPPSRGGPHRAPGHHRRFAESLQQASSGVTFFSLDEGREED